MESYLNFTPDHHYRRRCGGIPTVHVHTDPIDTPPASDKIALQIALAANTGGDIHRVAKMGVHL